MQPNELLRILLLSVLLCNPKYCNLRSRPISGGISKRKLLFCNVRFLKKLKLPTYGDIEPTSFKDGKFIVVTLWCRQPQVTPCQWQKWMLLFQDAITPKGSWVILSLNWSNANRRDWEATAQEKDKGKHARRRRRWWSWTPVAKPHIQCGM